MWLFSQDLQDLVFLKPAAQAWVKKFKMVAEPIRKLFAHYAQPKIQSHCIYNGQYQACSICYRIGHITCTYNQVLGKAEFFVALIFPHLLAANQNAVHGIKKAKDKEESEDTNYEFITVDRTLCTWPVNANAEPHLSDMVGQLVVYDFIVFDKDANSVLPINIPHMLKPDTMVECLFKLQYHHINGTHLFTALIEQVCILHPAIKAVPSLVKASPSKPYRPPVMSKLQFQQHTAIAEPSSFLAATAGPSHASGSKSSQKRKASEEPEGSAPKCVDVSGGKDSSSSLNQ
ncbi:hypothetical protein B0H14DRAFT_3149325 [Mycena olivaceomarginata]|nr:hypothetical protein B0H14DRAFT_3149325 [Mycena olivaceomarginata]